MCSGTLGGSDSEGKVIRLDLCDCVSRVSSKHIYHCCFSVLKEEGDVHAISPWIRRSLSHASELMFSTIAHVIMRHQTYFGSPFSQHDKQINALVNHNYDIGQYEIKSQNYESKS